MKLLKLFRVMGPSGLVGTALVVAAIVAALAAPLISPYSATAMHPQTGLRPPTAEHPLGTDELGRDILARVLYGGRVSIGASVLIVGAALLVGVAVGVVAGMRGGFVDSALMRIADVFLAFPPLLLAMAVAAAMGAGLQNALLAVVSVWWAGYARLTRGQTIAVRDLQYVTAAETLGSRSWRVALRHISVTVFGIFFE